MTNKTPYYPFHYFCRDVIFFLSCLYIPIIILIHILTPYYFIITVASVTILPSGIFMYYDFQKFKKYEEKRMKYVGGVAPHIINHNLEDNIGPCSE